MRMRPFASEVMSTRVAFVVPRLSETATGPVVSVAIKAWSLREGPGFVCSARRGRCRRPRDCQHAAWTGLARPEHAARLDARFNERGC